MELAKLSVAEFGALLGSDAPAPGGGAAAALCGALGAALTAMVGALTVGKEKYADAQELVTKSRAEADALQARFLDLMQRDAAAFDTLMAALALPKETNAEQESRTAEVQDALLACTEVPLETMKLAHDGLQLLFPLIGKSNRGAVSDLAVAALQLRAAAESAWFNVLVNTKSLKDKEQAKKLQDRGQAILKRVRPVADACCERVEILLL